MADIPVSTSEMASLEILLAHVLDSDGNCKCGQWRGTPAQLTRHLGESVLAAGKRTVSRAVFSRWQTPAGGLRFDWPTSSGSE